MAVGRVDYVADDEERPECDVENDADDASRNQGLVVDRVPRPVAGFGPHVETNSRGEPQPRGQGNDDESEAHVGQYG